MTLNVYNGKEIEKTYEADVYDVPFGVLDDLTGTVDVDKLLGDDEKAQNVEIVRLVMKSMPQVKGVFLESFPGLTEEELRRVGIRELIRVLLELIAYLFNSIMGLDTGDEKN